MILFKCECNFQYEIENKFTIYRGRAYLRNKYNVDGTMSENK